MSARMARITNKEWNFIETFYKRKGDKDKKKLIKTQQLLAKSAKIVKEANYINSLCYIVLMRK